MGMNDINFAEEDGKLVVTETPWLNRGILGFPDVVQGTVVHESAHGSLAKAIADVLEDPKRKKTLDFMSRKPDPKRSFERTEVASRANSLLAELMDLQFNRVDNALLFHFIKEGKLAKESVHADMLADPALSREWLKEQHAIVAHWLGAKQELANWAVTQAMLHDDDELTAAVIATREFTAGRTDLPADADTRWIVYKFIDLIDAKLIGPAATQRSADEAAAAEVVKISGPELIRQALHPMI